MYGVSPLKDSNIINNESPLKENNQMVILIFKIYFF